jgi:predicted dehydrogenase
VPLAFSDPAKLAAHPDVDLVAVTVKVPDHYPPVMAAIEAGKHVYCEWPLGRTTAEAVELAALAKATGRVTAVGLQARVNPALMYMKELVETGYVGEVVAVRVGLMRDGVLARPSHRTWQRDVTLGANTLTIPHGHTIDAMRFVVGELQSLSAVIATQVRQWLDTGTQQMLDVTAPDNVLVGGTLANGAVASVQVGTIPYAGSDYRMEIYGRDGTLVATSAESPQLGAVILHGAQRGNALAPLPVPARFTLAAPGTTDGEAINVGQMYARFAAAIRDGASRDPDFDTAVALHRLLDDVRRASDERRMVSRA